MKFISYVKLHFPYVRTNRPNILQNPSNILWKPYVPLLTSKNPLLWRSIVLQPPCLPLHPTSNLTLTFQPTHPALPECCSAQPSHTSSLPILLSHYGMVHPALRGTSTVPILQRRPCAHARAGGWDSNSNSSMSPFADFDILLARPLTHRASGTVKSGFQLPPLVMRSMLPCQQAPCPASWSQPHTWHTMHAHSATLQHLWLPWTSPILWSPPLQVPFLHEPCPAKCSCWCIWRMRRVQDTHTRARERARARTRTHTHIHTHTGGRAGQLPPGRRPLPLQRPPPPRLPLDRPMGLTRTRGAGGVTVVKSSSKTSKCSCLQEPWLCTHLQITRENQLYTSSPSEVHEEPRLRSAF